MGYHNSSGSRGALGAGPPFAPRLFFKSYSFQAGKPRILNQFWAQGPPPLGSKLRWAFPDLHNCKKSEPAQETLSATPTKMQNSLQHHFVQATIPSGACLCVLAFTQKGHGVSRRSCMVRRNPGQRETKPISRRKAATTTP